MHFRWLLVGETTLHGKFLLIGGLETGESLLFAGNTEFHSGLMQALLLETGREVSVLGAGNFTFNGVVSSWKSEGYKIETPEPLRKPIEQLLQKHREEFQSAWGKGRSDNPASENGHL